MGKNVVVIGTQWGDEGKGKIVDWLTESAKGVVRFHGGQATADDLAGVSARLSQAEMAASLLGDILEEGGASKN